MCVVCGHTPIQFILERGPDHSLGGAFCCIWKQHLIFIYFIFNLFYVKAYYLTHVNWMNNLWWSAGNIEMSLCRYFRGIHHTHVQLLQKHWWPPDDAWRTCPPHCHNHTDTRSASSNNFHLLNNCFSVMLLFNVSKINILIHRLSKSLIYDH